MKRLLTNAITILGAGLLASAAHAQVALDSVRVAAKDTVALARSIGSRTLEERRSS
jgi:hypothetical protein